MTALTGLAYVRHRDYSPRLGRFIQRDPLGFEAGDNNWYRFVENAPTGMTDPIGLDRYIRGWALFHFRLEVDEYDRTGNKTGRRWVLERNLGPGNWSVIHHREVDIDWDIFPEYRQIRSDHSADVSLLDFWKRQARNPHSPGNYLAWAPCFVTAPWYERYGMQPADGGWVYPSHEIPGYETWAPWFPRTRPLATNAFGVGGGDAFQPVIIVSGASSSPRPVQQRDVR